MVVAIAAGYNQTASRFLANSDRQEVHIRAGLIEEIARLCARFANDEKTTSINGPKDAYQSRESALIRLAPL